MVSILMVCLVGWFGWCLKVVCLCEVFELLCDDEGKESLLESEG